MLNFTLKQLEIFAAVAENHSFTAAAEVLYLSQSTVSSHIAELEQVLGQTLFSRTVKRQIELTPEGRNVYGQVCGLLTQCRELANGTGERSPELVIGTSTVPADHLLPFYMAEFLKVQPECRFVVKRGDSAAVHEMLRKHEVQLALVGTALDLQRFAYQPVAEDTLVVIAPNTAEYRALCQRQTLGWELLTRPLIFREVGSGTQRAIDAYLARRSLDTAKMNIVARIDSPEGIMNAVASGVGISVISALAAQGRVQAGDLLQFPLDVPAVVRKVFLAQRRGEALSAAAAAFSAMVKSKKPISAGEII